MWAYLSATTILWSICVALAVVIGALMIVRVAGRSAAKRFGKLKPESAAALEKAKPGKIWRRAEHAIGERNNPDEAKGGGSLALYDDELLFLRTGGKAWRIALADIKDMTEIRAASALDMAEDVIDAAPDYNLKLTFAGGEITFVVESATDWIAAIATARP